MRTGSCKYGSNCRFHHPDPTTVAGADPSPGYNNAGTVPVQAASHLAASSWSPPRALNDTAPYVPPMVYPTQGIPSPNTEWNGYQVVHICWTLVLIYALYYKVFYLLVCCLYTGACFPSFNIILLPYQK